MVMGKWELQVALKQINELGGIAIPAFGDLLLYDPGGAFWAGGALSPYVPRTEWLQNGFPSGADNTISFVNGTQRFTIAPTGADFDYYHDGELRTTPGDFHVITNADGQHWLYYDAGLGTVIEVVNPTHAQVEGLIEDECLIAMVYWNNNTGEGYLFDERHGYSMSPATHRWIHESIGMTWGDGLGVVDILTDQAGNLDTHAQFGNTAGEVYDEDVGHAVNAVAGGGTYECWWWDGTRWQWDTNAGFPFLVGGTPQPVYNNFGAGTLVEGGNNNFVLVHLFGTAAEDGNPIIIVGQAVYGTKNAANEGAATEISDLLLGNLPSPELKPIATIIIQIRNVYTNTNNCRLVTTSGGEDWVDWRSTPISPGGGTASDHGSLGGLAGDDHAWALNINGRAGGQIAYGGTAAGETLQLIPTTHATRGTIIFGTPANGMVWDDVNDRLGLGTAAPDEVLHIYNALNAVAKMESNAGNGSCVIECYNADQNWDLQMVNAFDRFTLRDSTNAHMVIVVEPQSGAGAVDDALYIDSDSGVGMGAAPASASEKLALTSTTAAFVLTRMTTVQMNAIAAPVDGMMVYDTTVGAVFAREGGAWVNL